MAKARNSGRYYSRSINGLDKRDKVLVYLSLSKDEILLLDLARKYYASSRIEFCKKLVLDGVRKINRRYKV